MTATATTGTGSRIDNTALHRPTRAPTPPAGRARTDAPGRRLHAPTPLAVLATLAVLAAGVAACGERPGSAGDEADREVRAAASVVSTGEAEAAAGSTGAAVAGAAEEGSRPGPRTPTSDWTDRRARDSADARFPHSAHLDLQCQRCHARPEGHVTHVAAACTACHARPAALAELPSPSARECASCHHGEALGRRCSACHDPASLGPVPVLASVAAGGGNARVRRLTFAHARHLALPCARCHSQPVTRRFGDDCSLCHSSHHRPEAECTACHDAGQIEAHDNAVHGGCAGGGCHDAATVQDLAPTRNVCLTCHAAQADHEVGKPCASCHVGLLGAPAAAPRGRR